MTNKRKIERVEERRVQAQKNFNKKCIKKVLCRLLLSAIIYILTIAAEVGIGFAIWNHFCPTSDFLEFIAWSIILGTIFFSFTGAVVEENFSRWYKKARISANIHRRKINRFFFYEKESLK